MISYTAVNIGNKLNIESKNEKLNYIFNYINSSSNKLNLNEFPLNLIEDIVTLNYLSGVLLFMLLNTFFTIIFSKTDIDKYLNPNSNNIIIKYLRIIILRNMRIWVNSNKMLFIISWIFLFISLLLTKICLFYITQAGC